MQKCAMNGHDLERIGQGQHTENWRDELPNLPRRIDELNIATWRGAGARHLHAIETPDHLLSAMTQRAVLGRDS